MRLPRYLTLMISLTAALALAVPALAEGVPDGEIPDTSPVEGTEGKPDPVPPVEDCRTLLPEPDGDETEGTGEEGETEATLTEAHGTDPVEDSEGADATDTEHGTAFAACVLEALTDVAGTAHAASIVAAIRDGIASGYPDSTFRPSESMTREQMATTLFNALDLEVPDDLDLPDDVNPTSVHAKAIAALLKAGIAQGDEEGNFNPAEEVRRGQMARFLDNAGLLDELPEGTTVELPDDVKGSVHEDAIAAALGNGVAQGFADGTFQPDAPVERGQMATIVTNALKLGVFPETVPES